MAKAQNKTVPTGKSVDDYIAGLDELRREETKQLIPLFQEVTGGTPVLWGESILGFGYVQVKSLSGREVDWFLSGFGPRKAAISIYLMCDFGQISELLKRLGKHTHGKGCLYIKKLGDVKIEVLKEIIEYAAKEMPNYGQKK